VELHETDELEPSGEDYEELHLAMQRNSYLRVIKGSNGEWYHLPHAEYTISWNVAKGTVLSDVTTIVKTVWKKFGVLVTESNGRTWIGLKTASASEVAQLTKTKL